MIVARTGTCSGAIAMFISAKPHRRISCDDRDGWQPHQLLDRTLKEGGALDQVMKAHSRLRAGAYEGCRAIDYQPNRDVVRVGAGAHQWSH